MKSTVTLSPTLPKVTIELTQDQPAYVAGIELAPSLASPTIKLDAISDERALELGRFFVGPKGEDADITRLRVVNPVTKIVNGIVQLTEIPRGELIHRLGMVFMDLEDDEVFNSQITVDRDLVVVDLVNLTHVDGLVTVPAEFNDKYLQVSYVVWE